VIGEDSLLERVTAAAEERHLSDVSEVLCLGPVYFLRLAPILPRRGRAQQFPPSRGVMGARSPHSIAVSLIC
jgi:hypothetical protein